MAETECVREMLDVSTGIRLRTHAKQINKVKTNTTYHYLKSC